MRCRRVRPCVLKRTEASFRLRHRVKHIEQVPRRSRQPVQPRHDQHVARLEAFKRRMGWTFTWVSSAGNDFNFDYHVSFTPQDLARETTYNYRAAKRSMAELPGISVFYQDAAGAVFHTYSCYARGLDMMNAAYHYLDLVPKGRDESGPHKMAWVRYRDSYGG
jgi:predicted dithiol-disulfide oxidoreductase (DUF899 family)